MFVGRHGWVTHRPLRQKSWGGEEERGEGIEEKEGEGTGGEGRKRRRVQKEREGVQEQTVRQPAPRPEENEGLSTPRLFVPDSELSAALRPATPTATLNVTSYSGLG